MKTYYKTESVKAKPMTLGDYYELRGWKIFPGQAGDAEGYLIEWDGRRSNHKDFRYKIGWERKDRFEENFKEGPF